MNETMSVVLYAVVGAALLGAVMGVFIDAWLTALLATVPLIVVPMGVLLLLRGYLENNPVLSDSTREALLELADPIVLAQMTVACAGSVALAGALIRAARAAQGDTGLAGPRRAHSVKKRVSAVSERTVLQNRTDRLASASRPAPPAEPPPVYDVEPAPVGSIRASSVGATVRDPEVDNNRRIRGRRKAILAGYLMFDDGRSSTCRIIDLSDTGARVRLPTLMALPEKFWLLNTSDWLAHEVKLAWRSDVEAGLVFLSKRNLREPVTDRDRALHALCAELAAR
jgi:hypothetical protein